VVPCLTPTLAAVAIGLGPLVRPDLGIFSIGFMAALLLSPVPERRAARLRLVGWALAVPLGYQLFRMGYFAALEPNTALAKEAGIADWSRGWTYLRDFVDPYVLVLPLVLVFAYAYGELRGESRPPRGVLATAIAAMVCGLVHAIYIVRVGGDFMHGRMLLPSLFGLLLPLAVVIPRGRKWHLAIGLAVIPWAIVCAAALHTPYAHHLTARPIDDERTFYVLLAKRANPTTLADYDKSGWARAGMALRRLSKQGRGLVLRIPFLTHGSIEVNGPPARSSPAPVVAVFEAVGIMGYAAGPNVHLVDDLGLADPIASRTRLGKIYLPPGSISPREKARSLAYAVVAARRRARADGGRIKKCRRPRRGEC
jgi:arabinofuranosyltransferase